MKIYRLKYKNIPRAAVLVTTLAGALLMATINPMPAQAYQRATLTAGAAHTAAYTTPPVTTVSTPSDTYTTRSDTSTSTAPSDTSTSTGPSDTSTSTGPSDTSTSTGPSDTSTSTTPPAITAPGAPTGVTAIPGDGFAVVSWDAPASDGGSAIEGYRVMASPGEMLSITHGATTAKVSGLTNGTNYTFTVIAFNAAGASVSSALSAAVTPTVSSITGITPTVANAAAVRLAAADAAAVRLAAANAAAVRLAAANAAAANLAAANATVEGLAVVPAGAPSTGAGGASQSSYSPLMGLGALALMLSGAAMVPAIRRRRRA
jgi:Fibronectin type III domain